MKKPPGVASISGGPFKPDLVSQAELKMLSEFQAGEYTAINRTRKLAFEISARLAQGATVESGPLEFDRDLGMARTAKGEGRKTG